MSVTSRTELAAQMRKPGAIAFVDGTLLPKLEGLRIERPVIAILDETDPIRCSVEALDAYPWLSHVVTRSLVARPDARAYMETLATRLPRGPHDGIVGESGVGRVARLAASNRRQARLERLQQFFTEQGMSTRAVETIRDVAEELVTNALFDAPAEAGYFEAVSREEDVLLPAHRACEISYGFDAGIAFVRVRDSFGSLARERLLDVLHRCKQQGEVTLDESRGGAGLGMWRVFSSASTVNINVVPGKLTEIIVSFTTTKGRLNKELVGLHVCFAAKSDPGESPRAADDEPMFEQSITLAAIP